MDEERIGLILAKTTELRSKIINCIPKTSFTVEGESRQSDAGESESVPYAENHEDLDDEDEAESLLNIKDALESLEGQLSSLQALQQHQRCKKEAALAEIEHSQRRLLQDLKQYEGKDLEVIRETISFAAEASPDLLLLSPPENGDHHLLPPQNLPPQSGSALHGPESERRRSGWRGTLEWVGSLMGVAVKVALAVVGVAAVVGLTVVFDKKREKGVVVEVLRVDGVQEGGGDGCPPGKVALKERVEVPPFESVVGAPDVRYGCG